MKNITYTPGPWHYGHSDKEASEPFFFIAEKEGEMNAPDLSIATVTYSGNNYDPRYLDEDRKKAEANARLIAAAPDLLEAAKLVAQAYIESGTTNIRHKHIQLLHAAIEKAEDRS